MGNIVKITIDSVSGPISYEKYQDRLEITREGANYTKVIEDKGTIEWSYETNNQRYQKKYDNLANLIEVAFQVEPLNSLGGEFTIHLLYDDDTVVNKTLPMTFEDNELINLAILIKDFIPHNEDLPYYLNIDNEM